ncbi:hypothetical protein HUG10_13185 [Halorarum halophilum]|uniref:MYM-type domain-containing protein n=1 Tax=Halorarum halophilum TaxID=2743090 RepID=A0A7D5L2V6_9EURY|nr:hypothetical protein [Halobaculum halophilum]QLG28443.1 hypothetical protein HUG10_13185 [Halobaculum halophilum]
MNGTDCAYCGCDVTDHDPISVREWGEDVADGDEVPFCNYGCLAAHIDDAGLALGTTCSVEL